jgi:catechol 2,3-dioxygenase-like lactoylglutathione lyase family enzyme
VDLVQSRFVTDDVARLAAFYGSLTDQNVVVNDYYVEVPTGGISIAFSKCRFTEIGDTCTAIPELAPRSGESILDFRTTDLDRAYARIDRLGVEWVLPPSPQPWGDRAMTFRDPEGHLVNVLSRVNQSSARR